MFQSSSPLPTIACARSDGLLLDESTYPQQELRLALVRHSGCAHGAAQREGAARQRRRDARPEAAAGRDLGYANWTAQTVMSRLKKARHAAQQAAT